MKASIIINPAVFSKKRLLKDVLNRKLTGWTLDFYGSDSAYESSADALRSGSDVLISVGGDGTANQVAQAILESKSKASLGIIPAGRANDLATGLGITGGLEGAVEALRRCCAKRIDVLDFNGKFVLTGGGFGIPAYAALRARKAAMFGAGSYIYFALDCVLLGKGSVEVSIISASFKERLKAVSLTALNQSTIGKYFRLSPSANNDDSLMDICIIRKPASRIKALKVLYAVMKGRHEGLDNVTHFRTNRIKVVSDTPITCFGDGELLQENKSFEIRCLPGQLSVLT